MRVAASDRQLMAIAVVVSLLVHAACLAIRFVPPPAVRALPFDSRLPVILVNARSTEQPLVADALAQASLDGGGQADTGRVRSPLRDLGKTAEGQLAEAQRQRVAELERQQQRLFHLLRQSLTGARDGDAQAAPDVHDPVAANVAATLARRQAELAREIVDYNARPIKRQLTPSTREVPYALYYTALRKKIEQTGTRYFPQSGGTKIYGELVISIPVAQDGFLYDAEGGPRIERSSGNPALDAAALAIVRRAAPFGRLPADTATAGDGRAQVWEVLARFSFTREQQLHTQPLAEGKE